MLPNSIDVLSKLRQTAMTAPNGYDGLSGRTDQVLNGYVTGDTARKKALDEKANMLGLLTQQHLADNDLSQAYDAMTQLLPTVNERHGTNLLGPAEGFRGNREALQSYSRLAHKPDLEKLTDGAGFFNTDTGKVEYQDKRDPRYTTRIAMINGVPTLVQVPNDGGAPRSTGLEGVPSYGVIPGTGTAYNRSNPSQTVDTGVTPPTTMNYQTDAQNNIVGLPGKVQPGQTVTPVQTGVKARPPASASTDPNKGRSANWRALMAGKLRELTDLNRSQHGNASPTELRRMAESYADRTEGASVARKMAPKTTTATGPLNKKTWQDENNRPYRPVKDNVETEARGEATSLSGVKDILGEQSPAWTAAYNAARKRLLEANAKAQAINAQIDADYAAYAAQTRGGNTAPPRQSAGDAYDALKALTKAAGQLPAGRAN